MQENQILIDVVKILSQHLNVRDGIFAVLQFCSDQLGLQSGSIKFSNPGVKLLSISNRPLQEVFDTFTQMNNEGQVFVLNEQLVEIQRSTSRAKTLWLGVKLYIADCEYGYLFFEKLADLVMNLEYEKRVVLDLAAILLPSIRYLNDIWGDKEELNETDLVGNSPVFWKFKQNLMEKLFLDQPLLLVGEAGSGKRTAVRFLHHLGTFNGGQPWEFSVLGKNENELAIYLLGQGETCGILERIPNGIIFIDHLEEMPFLLQGILSQIIRKKVFTRLGSQVEYSLTVRFIFGISSDLENLVKIGKIRGDLATLLRERQLYIPSLRNRGKADILLLVDHFVQFYSKKYHKNIYRVDTPAIDMLSAYHWPGNVRELENVVENLVLQTNEEAIHGHLLPPSLQMRQYGGEPSTTQDFLTLVRNYEIELITEALKVTCGNQRKAAKILGLTPRMIQYKITNYEIDYKKFH